MVLCFRSRPEMLLLALPVLLCVLLAQIPVIKQKWQVRSRLLRLPLSLLSGAVCSFFALGMMLSDPWDTLRLAQHAFANTGANAAAHYIFGTVRDTRYLGVLGILLLLLLPYLYLRDVLRKKGGVRLQKLLQITETVLIFAAFILTVIFIMPQFPQLAEQGIFYM